MESVLTAEFAEFFEFESVGVVFLVLDRVVVSLFALAANQRNLGSHFFGTSNLLPPSVLKRGRKKQSPRRGIHIITVFCRLVKG